jgi:hypothetical protein
MAQRYDRMTIGITGSYVIFNVANVTRAYGLCTNYIPTWSWTYTAHQSDIIWMGKQIVHRPGWCSDNTLDFYSRGAQFESRPGHRLCLLRFFVVFFSSSRQTPGLGHHCFLSYSLFTNHPTSWRYIIWYADSVKLNTKEYHSRGRWRWGTLHCRQNSRNQQSLSVLKSNWRWQTELRQLFVDRYCESRKMCNL